MSTPDLINGCFEAVGAYFTWANFRTYRAVRELRGVYWPTTAFFTAWGLWNLAYYPAINQPISFFAGVVLTAGNLAWLSLVLWDRRRTAKATPTRSAKTTKIGSVRRMVARCRQAFAQ